MTADGSGEFYGPELSRIHHAAFGDVAAGAAAALIEALAAAGHHHGTVVDLGSGSGILAAELVAAGYDVVGFDLSADMVAIARNAAPTATFHHRSVLAADLPPCVGVSAVGEVLNYATDERTGPEQLERLFGRVHAALQPGGVFVGDLSGSGRHDARPERFHDGGDWLLGMRAEESADHTTIVRNIIVFTDVDDDGRWRRLDEHHRLRLYEPAWVEGRLRSAGFATVTTRSAYGPTPTASIPPGGWAVFVAGA